MCDSIMFSATYVVALDLYSTTLLPPSRHPLHGEAGYLSGVLHPWEDEQQSSVAGNQSEKHTVHVHACTFHATCKKWFELCTFLASAGGLHKRMTFQASKMLLEAQGATSVRTYNQYYSVLAMAVECWWRMLMANLNNVQSTLRCYCPMPTYLVRVNTRSWTTSGDREATLTTTLTRITVSTGRTQILSCWDWPLTSLNSPFSGRSSSQTSQDRVNCVDK